MIYLFIKLGSYIFHPLWLPTYAMIYYFLNVQFMYNYESIFAKILAVILLTVFIPLFFLILLKSLGIISNLHLENIKQRRIPLLFFTTISAIIINFIFDSSNYKIPFYFFSGVFFCGLISVICSFLNYKISLHAVGISFFATFIIGFNLQYNLNSLWMISFSIFATGWVLSSRLLMKAHLLHELASGVILGIISQVIFMQFWLT